METNNSSMMGSGMPGQGAAFNSMQRPQPGNLGQQIHARVLGNLRNKMNELSGGWQAMFDIRERANRIMQLITMLRQINSDVQRCMQTAEVWEERMLKAATSKEQYFEEMKKKMAEITGKRQQQASQINLSNNGNPAMQGVNPLNMNMQNGMMNPQNMQNGMGFSNGLNMGMQPGQMNAMGGPNQMFPTQLQRQMQPSPLPLQPPPSNTMDPSALQMSAQSQQQQPQPGQMNTMGQQQQQQQGGKPQQPQMNMTAMNESGLTPTEKAIRNAKAAYARIPDEKKAVLRTQYLSTLSDQQRANITAGPGDPLMKYFFQKAVAAMRQESGLPTQPGVPQNGIPNLQGGGNNGPPRPPSQASGPSIDFSGIMGQQANALKLQESGEQVVPASNNNSNNNNNNNNMGIGGQMGMPQNINPQMLGNQNAQGGQANNSQMPGQMQLFMMQRDALQKERMQKQFMAQQHAMAARQQHSQLQGQPGGLHTPNAFNGAAVHSPAMPNLNRPIAPPSQGTPGTPQPNRPQQMSQTPMNGASQIAQHHQNMLNQNSQQQQQQQQMNQGGQNSAHQQALMQMLSRVPPEYRQKLLELPPQQMQVMLQRFKNNGFGANKPTGQAGPNQPGPLAQAGMQGISSNMAMHQNASPMPNMMPQSMANAPAFGAMPPQGQMDTNPQMQQRLHQQRQHMMFRSQAMDNSQFPKVVLTHLGISVPAQVQLWSDLKRHVQQQKASMPPGTAEKVQQQQLEWFKQNPPALQSAMAAQMQRQRSLQQKNAAQAGAGGLQQNGAPQLTGMMANGPAPQAQQVVPTAPMMQPPHQGEAAKGGQPQPNPAIPTPTAQEVATFRAHLPPEQQIGMTDDGIRNIIARNRLQKWMQMQESQRQGVPMARPPGPAQQRNAPNGSQPPQRTPQQAGIQPALGQSNQAKPGQASSNDVIEISSQPAQQQAPQAPAMQGTQAPSQPSSTLSEAERNLMVQKQRAQQAAVQREHLRKVQGQVGAAAPGQSVKGFQGAVLPPAQVLPRPITAADMENLKALEQEAINSTPRGPAVQLDAAGLEEAKQSLQKLWKPLQQIHTTFPWAIGYEFGDSVIKEIMRAKIIVQQNVIDGTGTLKDYLSAPPMQLRGLERVVAHYMAQLKKRRDADGARRQQAATQGSEKNQVTDGKASAPPMAANLSQQGHTRKPSVNKAPPAPTDNKKFDYPAPSPHGIPKYGSNELTPDKLKLPPQKKRRTDGANSQASTPAGQVGTPGATGASPALPASKIQSPDIAKKSQIQLKMDAEKEAELRKFHCKDANCDASLRGFDTEDMLKQHEQSQHQPVVNPLEFLLGNAANALGVDDQGKPVTEAQKAAPSAKSAPLSKPRLATANDLRRDELTRQESDQISRGSITASIKAKIAKKQAEFDAAFKEAEKNQTLREALTHRLDMTLPSEYTQEEAKGETAQVVDDDDTYLFWPLNMPEDSDSFGTVVTPERLGQMLADGWWEADPENQPGIWTLRPGHEDEESSPELTPNASEVSNNSDISQSDGMKFRVTMENMDSDPFGDGSGGVGESLVPIYHQVQAMMNDGDDALMSGVDEKDDGVEGEASKKRKAEEAWAPPIDDVWDWYYDDQSKQMEM